MAPIKFEEQFKEKLEKRTLQPSNDVWNKLSDKLDIQEERKTNKGYWWLGVAATVVGVMLAITFMFKNNPEQPIEPTIVDTIKIEESLPEQEKVAVTDKAEDNIETRKQEQQTKTETNKKPSTIKQTNQPILKQKLQEEQKKLIPTSLDEAVAQNKTVNDKKVEIDKNLEGLTFETQKVNEVVAKVIELQKSKSTVTDDEIDALLNKAQQEITMKKLYDEATNTVDADALLRDVEFDLDQSFRDKVFKALKNSYESVKTAVAQRNN